MTCKKRSNQDRDVKQKDMTIKYYLSLLTLFFILNICAKAQVSSPVLIGYWHNWDDMNAPYIQLDQIDSRYDIVDIAFAVPHSGTDFQMEFVPDQVTPATLISQIQTLQSQGKKVIISIGGASAPVSIDNITERNIFISTMSDIINTYGFDGIDIDLEGFSVSVTGGTIASPTDARIINLIYAIKQIMSDYYSTHNKRLILTMAPETAFVQGGMSAYNGIWGAYLPVIHALRDSIEILHVQLYNSGSMFGIDGNVYTQGSADFIVSLTEAVIQGFNTAGGMFAGLQPDKVAVGLPACPTAGGGFIDTATVKDAMDYLRGTGPQPGSYTLTQPGGYPTLRGMMTWSINWDKEGICAGTYSFANNYQGIFNSTTSISTAEIESSISIYPNPSNGEFSISISSGDAGIIITDILGKEVLKTHTMYKNTKMQLLNNGIYIIHISTSTDTKTQKLFVNK
ncbi:MAG TPA: glycosyl hydrolase family 18 protein [Bacteroidia bacterium]|nr:glycosyl hydrolase family 18 protein [Bacteroidia bacterium]